MEIEAIVSKIKKSEITKYDKQIIEAFNNQKLKEV